MKLKTAVVVACLSLGLVGSARAFDPTPTPLPQAPNSERPWPKTQIRLQIQEGLWKIVRIPFYLGRDLTELFRKGHEGYTKDFFKKYDLSLSYEDQGQSKEKVSSTDSEFEIFAYNRNFSTDADIFDFKQLLANINAYDKKSCAEVCPNGFEMLSINRSQLEPTAENFLGFRNKADDFTHSVKNQSGFCWGHSSVMDDFHYLGFFDPKNIMNQEVPSIEIQKDGSEDKSALLEFHKTLVDDIVVHGRATIIPGFANVREFVDSDKDLKEYVKFRVAMKWAKNAVKLRSIGNMFFDGKPMKKERIQNFVREVEKRILSNQTPRIIFAAEGDSTYSHVLNIYGISKNSEGTYRLYVFETNYYTELVPHQGHFIEISKDGNVTYAPLATSRIGHDRLGKVKFAFEEKRSEVEYVRSLNRFCKMMTRCQK